VVKISQTTVIIGQSHGAAVPLHVVCLIFARCRRVLLWYLQHTYIDSDVFFILFMPAVLAAWCRARKCKHFAALTVRSPRCRWHWAFLNSFKFVEV